MKYLIFFIFLFPLLSSSQALKFHDQHITLKKGLRFKLKLPVGYEINVAAEGLERPRFFAISPDGRLFITDLRDKSDNKNGRILILDDWNANEKKFKSVRTYLSGLHNPNQIAFHQYKGKQLLYVAETGKLSYYDYNAGDTIAASPAIPIASFPDYGLDYKYGGWHLTRSIAFHNNKLYVSIGSSCNACVEKEEVRAAILQMNPDGSGKRIYARGLRNSVGLKWVNDSLWVTSMGRDLIGPDKPEDLFHHVEEGGYYGWPFFYQYKKTIHADFEFRDSIKPSFVKKPRLAQWGFKAHSAPLGFEHFKSFSDPLLKGSFLVALHGSTSVWRQRGNAVVQMLPGGGYKDFLSGFLQGKSEKHRFGRPCDIIQWNEKSFFISDDKHGVIYFVSRS